MKRENGCTMLKQNFALLGIFSLLILQIIVIPQVFAIEVYETIDVGASPIEIAVNPATNTIYMTNQDDTISVIDGSNNSVVDTIDVGTFPRGVAVNPTTNTIYVTNSLDDTISVIDGSNNSVVDTIDVGTLPRGVAVNPTTNTIYVTNPLDDTISVIDGSNNSVVDTIDVEDGSFGVAVNPITNTIYAVSCFYDIDNISVIDGSNNSVVDTIDAGVCALAVAVNPLSNTIFVPNSNDNTILVIGDDYKLPVVETPPESGVEPAPVAAELTTETELIKKIEAPLEEQAPIQMMEESLQSLPDIVPYLGIIIAGTIGGVISINKINKRKANRSS